MKPTYYLFVLASCVAFAPGISFGNRPNPQSAQPSYNRSANTVSEYPRAEGHTTVGTGPTRARHSAAHHTLDLGKSAEASKTELVRQAISNGAQRPRLTSSVRPTPPSSNDIRHRGGNSAVITGSTHTAARNAGALSGTNMKRRP